MRTACAVRYASPIISMRPMDTSLANACTCASIRPGINVRPPASIATASFAAMRCDEISWMSPSATSTFMPSAQSAERPSKTRALVMRMLDILISMRLVPAEREQALPCELHRRAVVRAPGDERERGQRHERDDGEPADHAAASRGPFALMRTGKFKDVRDEGDAFS